MKYLILGTGGTGGCVGGFLCSSGRDVTFIARGVHLKNMKEKGLIINSFDRGQIKLNKVKAYSEAEDFDKVDVIFVCVKGYSLNESVSIIKKASHEKTIVIPILNSLSAGNKLAEALKEITVLDGCIYVSAFISAPGEITQGIKIFKLVFGPRENFNGDLFTLNRIKQDLVEAGIDGVLTNNIKIEIFKKFSFTSAYASVGAYYDVAAGKLKDEGKYRNMFVELLKELEDVAAALNIELGQDFIKENLKILDGLSEDTTASLQKDMKSGKKDEREELIFDVVRIADIHKVSIPNYIMVAKHFGFDY